LVKEYTGAALPHMLLVNKEFHNLHNKLRIASKQGNLQDWEKYAKLFADNIVETLECEYLSAAVDIIDCPPQHLPRGGISKDDAATLILKYQEDWRKWNNFNAGTFLREQLVCQSCARGWLELYQNDSIIWGNRTHTKPPHPKPGNTFIVGGGDNSCHITLNIDGFACHLPKTGTEEGFRCNGSELSPIQPFIGFALQVENSKYTWSNRLYLRQNPHENNYINKEITTINDYTSTMSVNFHHPSVWFGKLAGIIDVPNQLKNPWQYKNEIKFDFEQFREHSIVIIRSVAQTNTITGKTTIDYIISRSKNAINSNINDILHEEKALGLFLFIKERNLIDPIQLKYFYEVPLNVTTELSSCIGWKPNEGQLFGFKNDFFSFEDNINQTGSNAVRIDLNKRLDSPLISGFKKRNAKVELPIIQNQMKFIQPYLFNGKELLRINSEQKRTVSALNKSAKIFVSLIGFSNEKTDLLLIIYPENITSKELARFSIQPLFGFASFFVPRGPKDKTFRIVISAKDQIGDTITFSLKVEGTAEDILNVEDIKFSNDLEINSSILRAYSKMKLMVKPLELTESESNLLLSESQNYLEIVKSDIKAHSMEQKFSLPTGRIRNRYIGLDALCFPKRSDDYYFGTRLRSSGLFFPVPPPMEGADDQTFGSSVAGWNQFDEHLVRLTDDIHLLLTPHPLRDYGVSLEAKNLDEKGLNVTNHGTFIRGKIPIEFEKIPILNRPKFMDIYGETPVEHMETMNHIFNTIPNHRLKNYATNLEENFLVTHELISSKKGARTYCSTPIPKRANWKVIKNNNLVEWPINQHSMKAENKDGNTVFFDLLFVERKTGDEKRVILRRNHEDGSKEYLSIARFLQQNSDFWRDQQLQWVMDIQHDEYLELEHIFLWTGGKFESADKRRAYDWHYMQVETLRAFSIVAGVGYGDEKETFQKRFADYWPEPLRKFLLGGGKWDGTNNRNTDPMGGLLNNPLFKPGTELRKVLEMSVLRWTWYNFTRTDDVSEAQVKVESSSVNDNLIEDNTVVTPAKTPNAAPQAEADVSLSGLKKKRKESLSRMSKTNPRATNNMKVALKNAGDDKFENNRTDYMKWKRHLFSQWKTAEKNSPNDKIRKTKNAYERYVRANGPKFYDYLDEAMED
jgi:hypothetical protein